MGTMNSETHIHFLEEAMLHQEMAVFAARFSLSPAEAVVLPALFDRVVEQANCSLRQIVADATYTNKPLGDYLASVAREVAAQAAA